MRRVLLKAYSFVLRTWLPALCLCFCIVTLILVIQLGTLIKLENLPAGLATISAALLAFFGVAWQTNRGFKNLIASQEHQASLQRKARAEEIEWERLHAEMTQKASRRAISAALQGELLALSMYYQNTATAAKAMALVYGEMGSAKLDGSTNSGFTKFKPKIYESNIANLSLFPAPIIADIAGVFAGAEAMPDFEHVTAADTLQTALKIYAAFLELQRLRADHLIKRLAAMDSDLPDPGPAPDPRRVLEICQSENTKLSATT